MAANTNQTNSTSGKTTGKTMPPAPPPGAGINTGIYKVFGEYDKVNAKVDVVTTGLWSNDTASLTSFYTSSTQTASAAGVYYYNVYDKNPATDLTAEVQFAVSYGHINGSGSISLANNSNALLPTKATYAQYKSLLLSPEDDYFSFTNVSGSAINSNDIYVINVSRARYKEKMDPGNWQLTLGSGSVKYTFIDDSGKKFGDTYGKTGNVFKIVSGSLNLGTEDEATTYSATAPNGYGYGLFYPTLGILIFNPTALSNIMSSSAPDLTVAKDAENHKKLYNLITVGANFQARTTENVSTQHFFVRATNREFNFSNNPTYVDDEGDFVEQSFETDPKTYITTVGLYNNANELIAVAKTSQPIEKSYEKEVLIRVKLSF